jgi:hypothetical protein
MCSFHMIRIASVSKFYKMLACGDIDVLSSLGSPCSIERTRNDLMMLVESKQVRVKQVKARMEDMIPRHTYMDFDNRVFAFGLAQADGGLDVQSKQ